MAKESLKSKVVKDLKAAENAIVSEEKAIAARIMTKANVQKPEYPKPPEDEHIQEEM
ncbi:MAG TPA: hypothetical protein VK436_07485 [Methanocella sp.]|nr:hypothetical protein [Methanocella sp.]